MCIGRIDLIELSRIVDYLCFYIGFCWFQSKMWNDLSDNFELRIKVCFSFFDELQMKLFDVLPIFKKVKAIIRIRYETFT